MTTSEPTERLQASRAELAHRVVATADGPLNSLCEIKRWMEIDRHTRAHTIMHPDLHSSDRHHADVHARDRKTAVGEPREASSKWCASVRFSLLGEPGGVKCDTCM